MNPVLFLVTLAGLGLISSSDGLEVPCIGTGTNSFFGLPLQYGKKYDLLTLNTNMFFKDLLANTSRAATSFIVEKTGVDLPTPTALSATAEFRCRIRNYLAVLLTLYYEKTAADGTKEDATCDVTIAHGALIIAGCTIESFHCEGFYWEEPFTFP